MSLPVYLSSFVGRDAEQSEIGSLLQDGSIRMLTLIGPGGSGKTRLAFETIEEHSGKFEDGVYWVSLSDHSEPSTVPYVVAASLSVNIPPGRGPLDALAGFLLDREAVIVLDNCEHVITACAELAEGLLRECPMITIMATSRQKLGVAGEQLWPVPPLSYPTDDTVPVKSFAEYDAINLFQERARAVTPDFEIAKETSSDLIRISELLEGIPMAIELAASWIDTLSVSEMYDRLSDHLSRLEGRGARGEGRHRSMRDTLRWSYDLLSDSERILFRRLGVFVGGFTLEAAEAVCSEAPLQEADVLDLIARLIGQSLLVAERSHSGDTRYRQHEVVRQYAVDLIEAEDEAEEIRNRHLSHFVALVDEAEPHMTGADQQLWTLQLEQEYVNIRSALQHSLETIDGSHRLARSLFWLWSYTNRLEEGRRWTEMVLEAREHESSTHVEIGLTQSLATFTWLLGDYQAAQELLLSSVEPSEEQEYAFGIANARLQLGIAKLHQGFLDEGIAFLEESERILHELDHPRESVIALSNLGGGHSQMGEDETARKYAQQAVELARQKQDAWGLGLALSGLSAVAFKQGENREALNVMGSALVALHESGQRWLIAEAQWRLANILQAEGDLERAEEQLETCFALARDEGALEWQIASLVSLGVLLMEQGRELTAVSHLSEALRISPKDQFERHQLAALLGFVQAAARQEEWRLAAMLWGAFQKRKTELQLQEFQNEAKIRELIEAQQGTAELREWYSKDRETPLDHAASLALDFADRIEKEAIIKPADNELRMLALGPVKVYLQGRLLLPADWTFAKPKELLFYLASNAPKTKEQIGLVFWPDASPRQLRASLRAALYQLRRALGKREWILYENGRYRFNHDLDVWYDLREFEAAIQVAESHAFETAESAIQAYDLAVSLYRGDFLEDIANDEWAVLRREELRRKQVEALSSLAELYIETQDYERAIEVYRTALQVDELQEHLHAGLIRTYALQGARSQALRHYQSLVKVLQEELGVPPSPETTKLYRELKQSGP